MAEGRLTSLRPLEHWQADFWSKQAWPARARQAGIGELVFRLGSSHAPALRLFLQFDQAAAGLAGTCGGTPPG